MFRQALIVFLAFFVSMQGSAWASDPHDLAKKSQNPIGNIISLPFENNTGFGVGTEDAVLNILNLKPVYPVKLGSVNLINRGVLPIIYQEERFPGEGSEFGLGDFTYEAFFSPAEPGKVIWGAGPALVFPTNTSDRLGSEKWSAGPAFVVLTHPGPWLMGCLAQNVWSFAGPSDAPDVNTFTFQYFINYNFKSGWYLTSTPTITADWEADSGQQWTVPFGGGVGKLVRFGKLPVDFKGQVFLNAEEPDGAAEWLIQLQCKLLFPK